MKFKVTILFLATISSVIGTVLYQLKFDTQESIYTDLVKHLKVVDDIITIGSNPAKGRILLSGNMGKWPLVREALILRKAPLH